MARQIEAEVKNILKLLLQDSSRAKNTSSKAWYRVPSDNLANWFSAMNFLKSLEILDFEIIDNHGNAYTITLTPLDEYATLKFRYTVVNEDKLKQLCSEYCIVAPRESDDTRVIHSDSLIEKMTLEVFSELSPYVQRDAELIYKPKQGRLDLIIDDEIYQISLRSGQVKDIIGIAASNDYIDTSVSKGLIQQEVGHKMSDPLTTIMKDSIFMNELSNFAIIEPQTIKIFSKGAICAEELQNLEQKNYVKVVNRLGMV